MERHLTHNRNPREVTMENDGLQCWSVWGQLTAYWCGPDGAATLYGNIEELADGDRVNVIDPGSIYSVLAKESQGRKDLRGRIAVWEDDGGAQWPE
ncbi:hypothetical protein [Azospirillum sp. TSO22-1]|uniref:hypothetical protein n=1 Tax=Azospirillum sp. TSO22-1 TaxID=716789 RepID=UPI0011B57EEC|nr:hypothetical protein [Azospirillum sp. TSO22-1]